jgi:hypothetical protein
VIDGHFPVKEKENSAAIKRACEKSGSIYLDAGYDRGLHENLNLAVKECGISREDIVVTCDPDDSPSPGFTRAFGDVMTADPTIAVASSNFWRIEDLYREGIFKWSYTGKRAVWEHPSVEMISIASFNMNFIHDIGGFGQYRSHYGFLESYLYDRWKTKGMKLVYLPEVRADHLPVDRNDSNLFESTYRDWKTAHVNDFTGTYREWLQINKPELLT